MSSVWFPNVFTNVRPSVCSLCLKIPMKPDFALPWDICPDHNEIIEGNGSTCLKFCMWVAWWLYFTIFQGGFIGAHGDKVRICIGDISLCKYMLKHIKPIVDAEYNRVPTRFPNFGHTLWSCINVDCFKKWDHIYLHSTILYLPCLPLITKTHSIF